MRALAGCFLGHDEISLPFSSRTFQLIGDRLESMLGPMTVKVKKTLTKFVIHFSFPESYPCSFFNRSAADKSVSFFLQKQKRTCCEPSAGSL